MINHIVLKNKILIPICVIYINKQNIFKKNPITIGIDPIHNIKQPNKIVITKLLIKVLNTKFINIQDSLYLLSNILKTVKKKYNIIKNNKLQLYIKWKFKYKYKM